MNERFEVIFAGRKLGTASGFDQLTDNALYFYDFETELDLPKGDLQIEYRVGRLEIINHEDFKSLIYSCDLLDFLSRSPKIEQ